MLADQHEHELRDAEVAGDVVDHVEERPGDPPDDILSRESAIKEINDNRYWRGREQLEAGCETADPDE